jgi:hypothetical protein
MPHERDRAALMSELSYAFFFHPKRRHGLADSSAIIQITPWLMFFDGPGHQVAFE